jgi:hypothetical protein
MTSPQAEEHDTHAQAIAGEKITHSERHDVDSKLEPVTRPFKAARSTKAAGTSA